jgi:hypothetical protein
MLLCMTTNSTVLKFGIQLFMGFPGWTAEGSELSPGKGKVFLLSTSPRPTLGSTQPPIQWVTGTLSQGVKQPGREADHSPLTSAKVKNIWSYRSTPPYVSVA